MLERLREMLNSEDFKAHYRESEKDFTRSRVLTFAGPVASQPNLMSRSLRVGAGRFVERFFGAGKDYSKRAHPQRRSKLKAEAVSALDLQGSNRLYNKKPQRLLYPGQAKLWGAGRKGGETGQRGDQVPARQPGAIAAGGR